MTVQIMRFVKANQSIRAKYQCILYAITCILLVLVATIAVLGYMPFPSHFITSISRGKQKLQVEERRERSPVAASGGRNYREVRRGREIRSAEPARLPHHQQLSAP